MLRRKEKPLLIRTAQLTLEVRRESLDLVVLDLVRPEQRKVDRFAMLSHRQLDLWLPSFVELGHQEFRVLELADVAQRGLPTRIRAQDDVEADRLAHGAQRVEPNARLADLHVHYGGP